MRIHTRAVRGASAGADGGCERAILLNGNDDRLTAHPLVRIATVVSHHEPLAAGVHGQVRRADRASALLAIVGAVNVPIIYYSVQWWNTLHQGASVSLTKAPSMAASMLTGMLLMALAFWLYSIAAALVRVRCIIRERE